MSNLTIQQKNDLLSIERLSFKNTRKIKSVSNYFQNHISSGRIENKEGIDKINKLKLYPESFNKIIIKRSDWRIVINHWKSDDDFAIKVPISDEIFKKFTNDFKFFSQHIINDWSFIYFKYFDNFSCFNSLSKFLNEKYDKIRIRKTTLEETKNRIKHKDILFSDDPFTEIIKRISDLYELGDQIVIEQIRLEYLIPPGRFIKLILKYFYIEKTKKLDPDSNLGESLIKDFIDSKSYEYMINPSWSFGNELCRILIEKMESKKPPNLWVRSILYILGDPRDRNDLASYSQCWGRMSHSEKILMNKWLVFLDFDIFLNATNFEPDREKFIWKIINQYNVEQTRIIINPSDIKRLERYIKIKDLNVNYARLKEPDRRSIIYLKIKDKNGREFHIIEGTNNTSLCIFEKEPTNGIMEYKTFSIQSLLSYATDRIDHNHSQWEKDFWFKLRRRGFTM